MSLFPTSPSYAGPQWPEHSAWQVLFMPPIGSDAGLLCGHHTNPKATCHQPWGPWKPSQLHLRVPSHLSASHFSLHWSPAALGIFSVCLVHAHSSTGSNREDRAPAASRGRNQPPALCPHVGHTPPFSSGHPHFSLQSNLLYHHQ